MRNTALIDGVIRSKSTAYPQGRFSACVSVHMGLLRNRSQAQKTRRVETAGSKFRSQL
jgi:hypothetical protein